MRKFVILLTALVLCPLWATADSIVDVNIWGTFTATQPCTVNCTETIGISFQFDSASIVYGHYGPQYAWAVPGTINVSASGFLGSFTALNYGGEGYINIGNEAYMPFIGQFGDEIDILVVYGNTVFPVGTNTIGLQIYGGKITSAPNTLRRSVSVPQSFRLLAAA